MLIFKGALCRILVPNQHSAGNIKGITYNSIYRTYILTRTIVSIVLYKEA